MGIALTQLFSFVDRDMMMRYHWGHMPGHLYMHQRRDPTGHRSAGPVGQEGTRVDDNQDSNSEEVADGEDGPIAIDDYAQLGSESDNSDEDYDPEAESGDGSSGSEDSGEEGSNDDNDDDEWELESLYED